MDWDKGQKVGQHSSTNTLIEVATNTMALKHTALWLTIEGWVDAADTEDDKVFDTKPSHSHPPHPTTKLPPFHPSSLSNSNTLPSAIPQHSPPLSFCTLCACHSATTTHHFYHNQIVWASARVPAGSMPATQSQKRERWGLL